MSAAPDAICRPLNRLLKMAVIGGVEAAVQLHVERGDDLNARDDRGLTPLMLAASRNRARICRILIEAGADMSARDGAGNDARSIAQAAGAAECVVEIEAAMGGRAAAGEPPHEPNGRPHVPGSAGGDGPSTGVGAPHDIDVLLHSSAPSAGRDVASGIEPRAPAGSVPATTPNVGAVSKVSKADEPAFAIDDDTTLIDLSAWEGESESPPPEGDASLAAAPTAIHRKRLAVAS